VEIAVADDEELTIVGVSSTVNSVFPKLDVSKSSEGTYRLDIDPKDVKGATKAIIRLETDSPKLKYDYVAVDIRD
ncbi:MAG TPA: hypothetical protein VFH31_09430, partial [Pyrinomonadaceae bacterium]|nr:hypothetical protein [Pyrinomonadaceae bacterium]